VGTVRSTPHFDLLLHVPEADAESQRQRDMKEGEQLNKLIANIDRQLSNDKFLKSAPAHVIDSLRTKRAEYVARLEKLQ
jgi:valyl-tRNA synthetase